MPWYGAREMLARIDRSTAGWSGSLPLRCTLGGGFGNWHHFGEAVVAHGTPNGSDHFCHWCDGERRAHLESLTKDIIAR